MAPETTSYLYFVAKDERSHVFSKTFEEHTQAAMRFRGSGSPPPEQGGAGRGPDSSRSGPPRPGEESGTGSRPL